jgi:hypothetical protein
MPDPDSQRSPDGRGFGAKLGTSVFFATMFAISAVVNALTLWELHRLNNPGLPPIAGATDAEQHGEAIRAGFSKGLECRRLMQASWAGSWGVTALDLRDGEPWPATFERWSKADQGRRDDPLVRVMVRDLSRFYPVGGDRVPTAGQRREGFLYLSAFAAAFMAAPGR